MLDILYGLAKARDLGCSVVNMSLGFYTDDETCIAALNEKTSELDEITYNLLRTFTAA